MLRRRIFKNLPDELKECIHCHCALPKSEFYKNRRYKDGYYSTCSNCISEVRDANPNWKKNQILHQSKLRKNHPRKARSYQLKGLYGITIDDYDRMYANQQGCCKICDEHHDKLYIDHCHTTDKVRDLLCPCCNAFIGMAKEDINILTKAIGYINRHSYVRVADKTTSKTG